MTVSHVLARKYRPQIFADLVGQEALVQTITNAIEHNRLAHAYMLTGIRGIGKTSSARIIAKGLNCIGADGKGGMTPNPCGVCKHCREIAADSHIDVIEIDAASNTGVDNVREIIEGAKYNPVSARFKIYIIDEVHMLSKAAFNALLKTLEEPPERIKFIFATTEIRKVPVTILSRCQRFDLKRLDEETLTKHLQYIAEQEKVSAEYEALQLIARAGEGSVRDSLSLLDQAITQFDLKIQTADVRQMLGLADRTELFDLFELLLSGKVADALNRLDIQYKNGADPLVIIQDMLELTHWLTRIKILPDLVNDVTIPEAERTRGKQMAEQLSMGVLTSVWQLLLKGLSEVKTADNPLIALEMVLVRLGYLSDLPTPAQLIEDIKKNGLTNPNKSELSPINQSAGETKPAFVNKTNSGQGVSSVISAPSSAAQSAETGGGLTPSNSVQSGFTPSNPLLENKQNVMPEQQAVSRFKTIDDMVAFARSIGERMMAYNLESYIRPITLENFVLTCDFTSETPGHFSAEVIRFLQQKAHENWRIVVKKEAAAQSIKEKKEEKQNLLIHELEQTPVIAQALKVFAGSKVVKVKAVQTEDISSSHDENMELSDPQES